MNAVVTGLGVAAPNGLGVAAHWAATLRGRSGIRPLTRYDPSPYPVRLAGEVPGFEAADHLPGRLMPQTDRMTRLALYAAGEALADAGIDPGALPEYAIGVVTSATSGGLEFGQRELQKLWGQGWRHVSAYMSFAWYYAVNSGQISILHGLRGPGGVLAGEQAGGLDAVASAGRRLRGDTRVMVTGGADGSLCPYGQAIQLTSGRLSTVADPARAYLPFDAAACGCVPGEAGAILVLEEAEAARSRGYGEIAGYAATFGPGLGRAAEQALARAGVSPGDVDVVFADAAGTPDLDRAEAEAITAIFGPHGVPVTAPKTMTGRLFAAGGALDLVDALLSIRDGVLPPTVNVTPRYDLDLVTSARPGPVRVALVLARGYGGFNAAMVLKGDPR